MKWFRWYHGTCSSAKLGSVARRAGATRERVIAVWALLLESASEADDRGQFRVDADGIADVLNCETESVEAILQEMTRREMLVEGRVKNFAKRNPPRDNSTERVRKHRAARRKRDVTRYTSEETPLEVEEEREGEEGLPTTSTREQIVDEVIRAANRGMIDNPAIGDAANPIPIAHSSRQEVLDWLADGIPAEVIYETVYDRAKEYRPDGAYRRQVTSMAYFGGAVHEAHERRRAAETPLPNRAGKSRKSSGPPLPGDPAYYTVGEYQGLNS